MVSAVSPRSPVTAAATTSVEQRPTLRRGAAAGPHVAHAQQRLAAHGFDPGRGPFGPNTERQVRAFQRSQRLGDDGVIGPSTWRALDRAPGAAPTGGVQPGVAGTSTRRADAYVNGRRTTINVAPVGNGEVMRSDAAAAFNNMRREAVRDGITISARSGFRTNDEQAELYRRYRNGTGNLAARPGYSNHQGGISVDVRNAGTTTTPEFRWMRDNASRFGFVNDVRGEPWHWTFRG